MAGGGPAATIFLGEAPGSSPFPRGASPLFAAKLPRADVVAPPRARAWPMPARLAGGFTLSGVAGLAYELVWTRYLALLVGHAAYAQVLVLAVYLGGTAV